MWSLRLLIHFGVVKREERYLEAKFGDAYRRYMGRRAALWPAVLNQVIVQAFPAFVPLPRRRRMLIGNAEPIAGTHLMRTQVGIVGAGPAGLMLARLLHLQGIESIVIENRSRDYIENRIRAGLIEHWAADLLVDVGAGARMQRESMLHWGINIGINGELHRIDFKALVNKRVTIYGQQEVVKDLVDAAARRRRFAVV